MSHYFHSPVIFVEDIDRSRKFYLEYLAQVIEHDFGANILFKSHLSLWKISPQHEIARVAGSTKKGNTLELCFETENIGESLQLIKASGAEFLHEVKTEPWGQQTFRFFDPDGHLIEIGESLATFIHRIFEETGSVRETAERTGVPEGTVRQFI
ncbi:MAG: VOC family protein [Bacteroidales bacterium]|nr:VOC family protein [Bacteroidales bacterium]